MRDHKRTLVVVLAGILSIVAILGLLAIWLDKADGFYSTTAVMASEQSDGAVAAPSERPSAHTGVSHTRGTRSRVPLVSPREQLGTGGQSASLPPPGTPWEQEFLVLMDRAKAGDKAASDRLYGDTVGCMHFNAVRGAVQAELRTDQRVGEMNAGQVARELEGHATQLTVLKEKRSTCSGVDAEVLEDVAYPIILAAANNGNEAAAVCYVSGVQGKPGDGTPRALRIWKGRASGFMWAGLKRGDWKMVEFMIDYFNPDTVHVSFGGSAFWQGRQFPDDAELAYQLMLLKSIGVGANGRENDWSRMAARVSSYPKRHDLSAAQTRKAKEWAQRTYQQHFAGKPWPAGGGMSVCVAAD